MIFSDQLNLVVNENTKGWKKSFVSCKNQTYWHQIFKDCLAESCNVSSIADKIIDKSQNAYGKEQYWIYGYVLRSPVIVSKGCFSLKVNQKDNLHGGKFKYLENSAYECSRSCVYENVEYIFLMGKVCLCIPKAKFISEQSSYTEENIEAFDAEKELYSAYEIINQQSPPGMKLGNNCVAVYRDETNGQHKFNYTRCSSSLPYICEGYNKTNKKFSDDCNNETVSWYTASQNCQEKSLKLTSKISNRCSRKQHWVGTHVAERIIWGNDFLPADALCLTLEIDGSGVRFETERCASALHSLCYKKQHTTSKKENDSPYRSTSSAVEKSSADPTTYGSAINTESDSNEDKTNIIDKKQHTTSKKENDSPYRSTTSAVEKSSADRTTYWSAINTESDSNEDNTNIIGRTTYRSAINTESDSNNDKTNIFVLIVAGSVGGVLVLVIVLIIVIVIKRRMKTERENMDLDVVQRQPDTYSKPIKNTIPEESRKLVNVTEEGIYNHLGDSEKMIEMKQQDSSIYDVMGDDEYHVFTASGKRQKFKDDDDLYDHGASSDVYNTLNDTVTTNRPESDTYNVK
ncbi:unnamed protein product [Mytilus coruscus]|uniref:Uncharacterized protein n=1 Tax=Mytilus coruscus TaxID=42192 RepID=A0A6J8D461_MYTCO|nr:unnamed protein product [Mytilus coruscus]